MHYMTVYRWESNVGGNIARIYCREEYTLHTFIIEYIMVSISILYYILPVP